MQDKPAKPCRIITVARCLYRSQAGRRCRQPVARGSLYYCGTHADLIPPEGARADLYPELVAGVDHFRDHDEIHQMIANLLMLVAQDRLSARRGAVLAYTCNLLLKNLAAIERGTIPGPPHRPFYPFRSSSSVARDEDPEPRESSDDSEPASTR